MFKRLFTAILLTVLSVVLLISVGMAYLIVTPLGGKLLVRYFKQEFTSIGLISIGRYEGSLHEGFSLKNITIKGLSYLPNAIVKIQEIRVRLPLWDILHSDAGIFNARLFVPNSDPVVFTGDIFAGNIKGNLYGKSLDIHEASRFYASENINKNLQGYLTNIDLVIEGSLTKGVKLTGALEGDHIQYQSTFLNDVSAKVNLTLSNIFHGMKANGQVIVASGLVNVRQTNLQLSQSAFNFYGDITKPFMDIRLGANVEDMSVHMAIQGTLDSPQLNVSSDPPMAPQDALQMLFTGNAFSSATSPFNGVTSGQLAQNFLNYSLTDINNPSQFGMKTKLTQNFKLGMEMDELPGPPDATNVYYSREINGEMDMTNHTSLNVSREIFSQDDRYYSYENNQDQSTEDTEVYMQYKKRF